MTNRPDFETIFAHRLTRKTLLGCGRRTFPSHCGDRAMIMRMQTRGALVELQIMQKPHQPRMGYRDA